MTTFSLSPAAGAAPRTRLVGAHALMEARLLARNGEQLLLALVIPVLLLVGGAESGGVVDLGSGRRIDVLTPGVFALAVLSSSFTSLAIATGFERRYGVLKRLGATPLSRSGLLAGKVVALLAVELMQIAVIAATAFALGWEPAPGLTGTAWTALLLVIGTAAFAGLALLLAGTLRAEATLAAANLVYVVLVLGGAVLVPVTSYPDSLQPWLVLLPSGALAEGLREALAGQSVDPWYAVVLIVWALVGGLLAGRYFRWE